MTSMMDAPSSARSLGLRAEARRTVAAEALDPVARVSQGQFFTPLVVAEFMASMFRKPLGPIRILDPGAGAGTLTAALVERLRVDDADAIHLTVVEQDLGLQHSLTATLQDCRAAAPEIDAELVQQDFVEWGLERCTGFGTLVSEPFDLVVMNPPYRKIGKTSTERKLLESVGVEVSNLYAAFIAIGVRMLKPGGQLVAITPRSFANGPYFRSFRTDFLQQMTLQRMHVYETRDTAFADSGVLQENIIFHAIKGAAPGLVTISSSAGAEDESSVMRTVPYGQVVDAEDPDRFIHLAVDECAAQVANSVRRLTGNLRQLNCSVSTGRVVDFRAREHLRASPQEGTVPLLYPAHCSNGGVTWPKMGGKKPNALALTTATRSLTSPPGIYVLVKRFSSKEERRRVVAVVCDSTEVQEGRLAFENHLNVFHDHDAGLPQTFAQGLACYLNSTLVDLYFRQFSGHTQVNAADLRKLPYPTLEQLSTLGAAAGRAYLEQDRIDALVADCVEELQANGKVDPLVVHRRVTEVREILRALGLPAAQTNERSALTLLALLDLAPGKPWSQVGQPLMGITPMMDFMREAYGKNYAPNSRETIRRQTVHQFISAGICVQNPDDPSRPTNSGNNVYQVPDEVVAILRRYGQQDWEEQLERYVELVLPLAERWAAERDMARIPVTLPSGHQVTLSPGGQNVLVKLIVDEFCSRFAPGGQVLYIGDADEKFAVCDLEAIGALGISVPQHGKMPDLMVYRPDKGWLLVIEAVTSHGPMDAKRVDELRALLAGAKVPLVLITAFPDRASLRKYLGEIAWETEVWVAESPTHLIHFNGEKFLGPYGV